MKYSVEEQLNLLLRRNYDAEAGYQQAHKQIKDKSLRSFFERGYQQRNSFGHQIKRILSEKGIEPKKGTTMEADVHRKWMDFREALSLNNDMAILKEARRGEKFAINDYKDAIDHPEIDEATKNVLAEHLRLIKDSRDQLGKLEAVV